MEPKCLYPDWEGGIIKNENHNYDKDGFCIICGYKKMDKLNNKLCYAENNSRIKFTLFERIILKLQDLWYKLNTNKKEIPF